MGWEYVALCWYGDAAEIIAAHLKAEGRDQLISEGWEECLRARWRGSPTGGACIMRRLKAESPAPWRVRTMRGLKAESPDCALCNGKGQLVCPRCTGLLLVGGGACPLCGGSGFGSCLACKGTGREPRQPAKANFELPWPPDGPSATDRQQFFDQRRSLVRDHVTHCYGFPLDEMTMRELRIMIDHMGTPVTRRHHAHPDDELADYDE